MLTGLLSSFTRPVILLGAFAITTGAFAQQVTMLEVRKESANENRTTVEVRVPIAIEGMDFNNPLDAEQSLVSIFSDDQDGDLLQIHKNQQAELRDQGYTTEPVMTFGGVADYSANEDIKLRIAVGAAPSDEATMLRLAGRAVLNFAGNSGPKTVEIINVPVEMAYDSKGFASEIGPIMISSDGSAELNGVSYRKFTVSGTNNFIIGANPAGGDDSAEVDFWSVAENQFVFKNVPKFINLEVIYTPVRKVPVDFDLLFSIGLGVDR